MLPLRLWSNMVGRRESENPGSIPGEQVGESSTPTCSPRNEHMDRNQQLTVFKAQTENTREVDRAWKTIQRTINAYLSRGDMANASLCTKIQTILLCAFSESIFSKLIHTPYGFELSEITQIKLAAKSNIVDGWKKCLELGLRKVGNKPSSSYIQNTRKSVARMIDSYITPPSLLRNKVAHGQWIHALNREHTNVNMELSNEISSLNTVRLAILKEGLKGLYTIIESLIESPNSKFHSEYWKIVANTEETLQKMEKWTIEDKVAKLRLKASRES